MIQTKNLREAVGIGAVTVLSSLGVGAIEIDLSTPGDTSIHAVAAGFGGDGAVQNFTSHPSGTGVFDPFLTLERNSSGGHPINMESAYNTAGHTALYLDEQRPEWNTRLRLGDLAVVTVQNARYYAFELDANEPGADKSIISIDNVRIYTSASDHTAAVNNNEGNLDSLGTLRWAMNQPLGSPYNVNTWIKLDANLSDQLKKSNGGSGWSDMLLYVPVSAFAGASADDYVWFYNLNGVHYNVDPDLGAEAGYEEWRAVFGPNGNSLPDGGTTATLLGAALLGLGACRRIIRR